MTVNYKSVFDIIGPIMIGPSSSHTAGACAIGRAANSIFRRNRQILSFITMNHLPKPIRATERTMRLLVVFLALIRMIAGFRMPLVWLGIRG